MFFAYTDAHGIEMWISNGTFSGTRLIKDIYPGSNSAFNLIFGANIGQQEINKLKDVAILENSIYFAAWDGSNGMELWTTDGTPNGTEMVKDIKMDDDWSRPSNFTVIGDSFYFSADQGQTTGRELWFSDGTQTNTNIVTDLKSGAQSSIPDKLIHALDRLFFTADDGVKGTELWALLVDSDDDGFTNDEDNCKFDANPLQENNDLDGMGDACDADDDNDGFLDVNDAFPFDPTEWLDTDSDGIGNNADLDDDNDGVPDVDPVTLLPLDNCPLTANPLQEDADEDGTGDACEIDESMCFPIKSQSGATALICL